MIKIRYRDPNELSPGLHAAAERRGRNTIVYLLSGLSAEQRRAALRRLKISARRGYDPKLPASQLAVALAADRIRTTVGRAGAVFRSHPAGSTVPVMVISAGAIAFLALSAVSIHVIHPRPGPPSSAEAAGIIGPGAGPDATVRAGPGGTAGPGASGLADPGQGGSAVRDPDQPGSGSSAGDPAANADNGNGNGTSGSSGSGTDPSSDTGSGATTLTGGEAPTPTPGGDTATTAPATSDPTTPAASPATSRPSATPSTTKSGTCLDLGPLGVCL